MCTYIVVYCLHSPAAQKGPVFISFTSLSSELQTCRCSLIFADQPLACKHATVNVSTQSVKKAVAAAAVLAGVKTGENGIRIIEKEHNGIQPWLQISGT